jgi:hypothetical protein
MSYSVCVCASEHVGWKTCFIVGKT